MLGTGRYSVLGMSYYFEDYIGEILTLKKTKTKAGEMRTENTSSSHSVS